MKGDKLAKDSPGTPKNQTFLTRFDQALLTAKNKPRLVAFDLATPTSFTDSEGTVSGHICQVDKFSIEIEISSSGRRVWISKAMIVGTEIL